MIACGYVFQLILAWADQPSYMRNEAATSLGKIGPAAEAAVPALTAMYKEGGFSYAGEALRKINGK